MTKEQRSRTMSRIRSTKTNFEVKVFSELRKRGVRFKTNYAGATGKPDIALPKIQRAVFLHSDFWHGWRLPSWESILPNNFWKQKLRKNRLRDKIVVRTLRKERWRVLVVWEHQLEKEFGGTIQKITKFLNIKA